MNGNGKERAWSPKRILVTGCAGFIGSHLAERLLLEGHEVLGVDCFSDFYARPLKQANLAPCLGHPHFRFEELDLARDQLDGLLAGIDTVYHLAAQPGVRGSFGDGFERYVRSNVHAMQRLLEAAVVNPVEAFVYASSSSVYGNAPTPTHERVARRPVSPYGMTKLAAEEIAAVYHRSNGVPVIGLRYFTVYGPRQRPDMALSCFLSRALAGEAVPIIGDGLQRRDLTYVGDIVDGTLAAARHGQLGSVYNIGGGRPTTVLELVEVVSTVLGQPIDVVHLPQQRGEAAFTHADTTRARIQLGFVPKISLEQGVAEQLERMRRQPPTTSGGDPLVAAVLDAASRPHPKFCPPSVTPPTRPSAARAMGARVCDGDVPTPGAG